MSSGGAPIYVDKKSEAFLFPCEVLEEELAMWGEMLLKIKETENRKKPVETIH